MENSKKIKTKFINFRVEEEFPLTSEEVRDFLKHCVDYFTMAVKGRIQFETYLNTVEGKKISKAFKKLMDFIIEPE